MSYDIDTGEWTKQVRRSGPRPDADPLPGFSASSPTFGTVGPPPDVQGTGSPAVSKEG